MRRGRGRRLLGGFTCCSGFLRQLVCWEGQISGAEPADRQAFHQPARYWIIHVTDACVCVLHSHFLLCTEADSLACLRLWVLVNSRFAARQKDRNTTVNFTPLQYLRCWNFTFLWALKDAVVMFGLGSGHTPTLRSKKIGRLFSQSRLWGSDTWKTGDSTTVFPKK